MPQKNQKKRCCKLPKCSRCGERLHLKNGFLLPSGRYNPFCKECTRDMTFINRFKKLPAHAVFKAVEKYQRYIDLLNEVLDLKLGKEVNKRGNLRDLR